MKSVDTPPTLFIKERSKKGMYAGLDDSIHKIKEIAIPRLEMLGFNAEFVKEDKIFEKLPPSDYKKFSRLDSRFLKTGAGILVKISYGKDLLNCKFFQIFVIRSTRSKFLGNLPRFNIPNDIINQAEKSHLDLRSYVHTLLTMNSIHFLIMTSPADGVYWTDKFSSHPADHYTLTWRKKPYKLDRLVMKARYQVTQFHSISTLKETLIKLINNENQ